MIIKYLGKKEYEIWDKFVESSLQGSIFSYSWYLDALQVKYYILVVSEENRILAGIVLAKNEIGTFSNPMLDKYLGVLFAAEQNYSQKVIAKQYKILEMIINEIKQYKSFDYYFNPNFKNWIPFYWNGFSQQTRYTYRLELNKSLVEMQGRFHGNLRNDIKNAVNSKVICKKDIEFSKFYEIINKTFLRQGSKSPFDKIKLEVFISEMIKKEKFVSFGAYDQKNNLIAVCGLVFDKHSSYLILNGIDIENQIRGANALLIFETINFFLGKCEYFDFEGSMLPGVEQFYRRFGGELTPYMKIWNDNFFNYAKSKAKDFYKKMRYGR